MPQSQSARGVTHNSSKPTKSKSHKPQTDEFFWLKQHTKNSKAISIPSTVSEGSDLSKAVYELAKSESTPVVSQSRVAYNTIPHSVSIANIVQYRLFDQLEAIGYADNDQHSASEYSGDSDGNMEPLEEFDLLVRQACPRPFSSPDDFRDRYGRSQNIQRVADWQGNLRASDIEDGTIHNLVRLTNSPSLNGFSDQNQQVRGLLAETENDHYGYEHTLDRSYLDGSPRQCRVTSSWNRRRALISYIDEGSSTRSEINLNRSHPPITQDGHSSHGHGSTNGESSRDKELPSKPVLRPTTSPERRGLIDARDFRVNDIPYPALTPERPGQLSYQDNHSSTPTRASTSYRPSRPGQSYIVPSNSSTPTRIPTLRPAGLSRVNISPPVYIPRAVRTPLSARQSNSIPHYGDSPPIIRTAVAVTVTAVASNRRRQTPPVVRQTRASVLRQRAAAGSPSILAPQHASHLPAVTGSVSPLSTAATSPVSSSTPARLLTRMEIAREREAQAASHQSSSQPATLEVEPMPEVRTRVSRLLRPTAASIARASGAASGALRKVVRKTKSALAVLPKRSQTLFASSTAPERIPVLEQPATMGSGQAPVSIAASAQPVRPTQPDMPSLGGGFASTPVESPAAVHAAPDAVLVAPVRPFPDDFDLDKVIRAAASLTRDLVANYEQNVGRNPALDRALRIVLIDAGQSVTELFGEREKLERMTAALERRSVDVFGQLVVLRGRVRALRRL